jgi:hypothetical protein
MNDLTSLPTEVPQKWSLPMTGTRNAINKEVSGMLACLEAAIIKVEKDDFALWVHDGKLPNVHRPAHAVRRIPSCTCDELSIDILDERKAKLLSEQEEQVLLADLWADKAHRRNSAIDGHVDQALQLFF